MLHSVKHKNESSNHFEAFFMYATLGVLVINNSGEITTINPFALKEFGYTREELIGKKIELLVPTRFRDKHIHHREKYTEKPRNRPMGVKADLYALKKDGTEFPVQIGLGNYHFNGEEFVIAFISNMSAHKKAEAEVIKLNNELETKVEQRTRELTNAMHQLERSKEVLSKSLEKERELNELKSRFVSMASHEFRTPLSTVLSSAYLIDKYTAADDQPKREKHLQRIISSVNMLTDILNDFLNVGKIEEGRIPVRFSHFNIRDLIEAVTSEIKNTLKKQQKIQYHHEGNPEVLLDTSLMKHIIMNLVSNASKFSPETSDIRIETITSDHTLILSVKDHGIGIAKEDQRHLMERFFRGANAGNIQGTGLGLHIVSKYAELMSGTVECKSELGKGTEFLITFDTKTE